MDCQNLEFNFLRCMKKLNHADNKCKKEFDSWFNCYETNFTTLSALNKAPSIQPCFKENASPQICIPSILDKVFITL